MGESKSLGFAVFYWWFYGFQALIIAFFPLYCDHIGFSAFEIALITAAENIAVLFGPPLVLKYSHGRFSSAGVIAFCAFGALIGFLPLLFFESFGAVFIFWLVCLFLSKVAVASVNAVAVRFSEAKLIDFGRTRIWGSLGFITISFLLGKLYDVYQASVVHIDAVGLLALIFFASLLTQSRIKERVSSRSERPRYLDLLKVQELRGSLVPLFLSIAFSWASHAVLYTYFSIYLEQLGWSGLEISLAWGVAVFSEIGLFWVFSRVESRYCRVSLYRLSLYLTLLRWILVATFQGETLIYLSQVLHAFSFGSFYILSLKLTHVSTPHQQKDAWQSLMYACSGAGLLVGRLSAGVWAERAGDNLQPLFWLSALFALFAIVASLGVRGMELEEPDEKRES